MAQSECKMTNFFPLIRHISTPVSNLLIKLPITPNQITFASLACGLAACFYLSHIGFEDRLMGSLFFLAAYILDNCDGEIARMKQLSTAFGEKLDTFVDWIVNTGFFAALGYGVAMETGNDIWWWFGLFGSAGGTINYLIVLFLKNSTTQESSEDAAQLNTLKEYFAFVFRELFRADFCFIVLALSLIDGLWILLPTAALGAHVYWISYFMMRDKNYHV
jgi:phosphatidylglycerophosphate synthase